MTKEEIPGMMKEFNIPFAYDHFAEGESPDPPFLVYLYPRSANFSADGKAFFKKDKLNLELYTDKKDMKLESKVEAVLDGHGFFYAKSEVWIDSEKMYEVLYETEV